MKIFILNVALLGPVVLPPIRAFAADAPSEAPEPTPADSSGPRTDPETPSSASPTEPDPELYSGWWTGALLTSPGRATPPGHVVIEPYLYFSDQYGDFNNAWGASLRSSQNRSPTYAIMPALMIAVGIIPRLDASIYIQGAYQATNKIGSATFGDMSLRLDYQIVESQNGRWVPDVLFILKGTFPTGSFQNLDAQLLETDANGSGAWAASFGLNFQKVFYFPNDHLFRVRANFSYSVSKPTDVQNVNAYSGGNPVTGTVHPGVNFQALMSAEFHLTKRWVAALDLFYNHLAPDVLITKGGSSAYVSPIVMVSPMRQDVQAVPAIEYNFNENIGVIVGTFLSVAGRNRPLFFMPSMAVNMYF